MARDLCEDLWVTTPPDCATYCDCEECGEVPGDRVAWAGWEADEDWVGTPVARWQGRCLKCGGTATATTTPSC